MKHMPLVSIIINNYNYDQYVQQAIDSALQQHYPECEIIIVDDGSTDNSRSIIAAYTEKAIIVLKENGGQASAFNAGFRRSKGDIIFFLDADDCFKPDTVTTVVKSWSDEGIAKCHWKLEVIDSDGKNTGDLTPHAKLMHGDLRMLVATLGPNAYVSPPTSGNAWSRKFLQSVLPMPEEPYRISADNYLCMLAPLYGSIHFLDESCSYYRLHGKNNFRGKFLEENLLKEKEDRFDFSCEVLKKHLAAQGIEVNVDEWSRHSWLKQLSQSIHEIQEHVPEASAFILADGDQWQVGQSLAGRTVIPFIEKDNRYWGMPSDDDEAIREIERHQDAGYIFFASPVFWFKDHYGKFFQYLASRHQCVVNNDRLLGYKLITNT